MTMTDPAREVTTTTSNRVLDVRGLQVAYGSVVAVRGISLHVNRGEIVALLGPNGAGKTSTLRGITSLVRPTGRISVNGRRIERKGPAAAVKAGMAHVPEGRRVFPEMTVLENLRLGAWEARRQPKVVEERLAEAFTFFPRLSERRSQAAGSLSGGEQQMLAISRALMSKPEMLLIDELSLGLSPLIVDEILTGMVELNQAGLSVLLIEQFVHRALGVSDRIYVLKKGRVSFSGTPAEAVAVGAVEEAYL